MRRSYRKYARYVARRGELIDKRWRAKVGAGPELTPREERLIRFYERKIDRVNDRFYGEAITRLNTQANARRKRHTP